jgi:predicted XRE-type DNA-binding protein
MKSVTPKARPKRNRRLDDKRSIVGSRNVFIDLGFDEVLQEKGYTQVEAARRLGLSQRRSAPLLKGAGKDFSVDVLLTLATRAGLKPELHLAAAI